MAVNYLFLLFSCSHDHFLIAVSLVCILELVVVGGKETSGHDGVPFFYFYFLNCRIIFLENVIFYTYFWQKQKFHASENSREKSFLLFCFCCPTLCINYFFIALMHTRNKRKTKLNEMKNIIRNQLKKQ